MSAIDAAMVSNILNATLPCGTAGKPAAFTALNSANPMQMRLDSTAPTASAEGTQLTNGNGGSSPSATNYASPGWPLGTTSVTASSAGSSVTLPAAALSSVAPAGGWAAVYGLDIVDGAATPVRSWFGTWNGAPIAVAAGNTFQVAANAVTVSLT